jgi:hypothetical protein
MASLLLWLTVIDMLTVIASAEIFLRLRHFTVIVVVIIAVLTLT